MIELRHVSKGYMVGHRVNQVLDDLSIELPADRNIGILGRNGQGKSTLLRIIGGILTPDSGEVRRHVRVSWPIGFGGGLAGSLSGEENARFVARIYEEDVDEVCRSALEFSELGSYFYMPVKTYSAGMRARLAFALSMAVEFEVYLIDEVTAVGDRPFQEKCRNAFSERRERASVFIVSHNMATIKQYAQQCGVLSNGKLELYDSVDQAIAYYNA